MGRARYVSGGAEGRYTIEIDFGSEVKQRNLDLLNARRAQLTVTIAEQQVELWAGEAIVAQIRGIVQALTEEYINAWIAAQPEDPEAPGVPLPSPEPLPASKALTDALEQLRRAEATVGVMRAKVEQWKAEDRECAQQIKRWEEFESVSTRDAWCVDYTEEPPDPDLPLATIEIEGEPQLILVGPGAKEATNEDGAIVGREAQRGYQLYWNAAVLPGWQKWRPTYRTGVLTAIYPELNRGDVALDPAASTAQGLNINQAEQLEFVPFRYMDCDYAAFEVYDRVVVEFRQQEWALPQIIGFVDTPRPCGLFKLTGYAVNCFLTPKPSESMVPFFVVAARVDNVKASEIIGDLGSAVLRLNGIVQPYEFSLPLQNVVWREREVPNSPYVVFGRVAVPGSAAWTCDDYLFAVNAPGLTSITVQLEFRGKVLLDATLSMPVHGYVNIFDPSCNEPAPRAPVLCTIVGQGYTKPSGREIPWIALNPPPEEP